LNADEILTLAAQVITQESCAAAAVVAQLEVSLVNAAQALLACQGHVLVAGSGTSHPVGARLAHLLSCCGTPALFIHPGDSQHGLSGAVTANDVLIAISKGGETVEVNHLARIAKNRGAALIALTEKPASTLAQMSDIVLKVVAPPDVDPYGMIATGSSLVNSVYCDALCVVMLNLRGYSKDAFSQTHPGGAVGIQIKSEKV
jgi:D-arabinose 5-phosphate isomerase GutQ